MSLRTAALLLAFGGADAVRAGGSAFLGGKTSLQPEVVANMLVKVEDNWKSEAMSFVECNKTADGDCTGSVDAFQKSCNTVTNAVMQASNGDRAVVQEYMGDVCGAGKLAGWRQEQCTSLAQAITKGMTASEYENRENLDLSAICKKFWTVFVSHEAEAEAKEAAVKASEEKEAAAAEAAREVEERKAAQEKAEQEAKEAEEAAKAAKEHAAESVLAKSSDSLKTAKDAKEEVAVAPQNQTVEAAPVETAAPAQNATVETAAAAPVEAEVAPVNATAPAEAAPVALPAQNVTVEATVNATVTANATEVAAPAPVVAVNATEQANVSAPANVTVNATPAANATNASAI